MYQSDKFFARVVNFQAHNLDIQKILANDMPVVNLFELEFLVVYNTKLKGAYGSAMGAYASFGDAYLD